MTLGRFLLTVKYAQEGKGIKPIVPAKPIEVGSNRWQGMLRYYGTHHAQQAEGEV